MSETVVDVPTDQGSDLKESAAMNSPKDFYWFQTKEEMILRYQLPPGIEKKQLIVKFRLSKLFVSAPVSIPDPDPLSLEVKVRELLATSPDGAQLYMPVDPDESTWTIERDTPWKDESRCNQLVVTLIKAKPGQWPSLLKELFVHVEMQELRLPQIPVY